MAHMASTMFISHIIINNAMNPAPSEAASLMSCTAPNAYVHDAPMQAQPCDAPANEYAPEAQNEPVTPAEVPEFVEKSDYNETNNTQE